MVDRVLVGRGDVRLSEEGRREAARLATCFTGRNVSLVQSSPRERARETAAPLAEALGLTVEIVPALDEIDFGRWTGRSFEKLAPDPSWQAWNATRSTARPPGGESMIEAQARVVAHIERLGAMPGGTVAVLVSHCDVIRAALLQFLGRPVDAWRELEVAPASVSAMEIGSRGPSVVALNEERVS